MVPFYPHPKMKIGVPKIGILFNSIFFALPSLTTHLETFAF